MMYDTLMQMGRWFGYRPGYEDLCRVWMPADGVGWYAHIHEAMEDLQAQLKRMELVRATPEQFGLAVRSHPEALIVTARNKMGTGKEFPVRVGLAGKLVETTRIRADRDQLERNRKAGEILAAELIALGIPAEPRSRGQLYKSVPVDKIREFLRVYRTDAADPLTDPHLMSDYLDARADTELKKWDVLLASAHKDGVQPDALSGIRMTPFERSVSDAELDQGVMAISGTSRRVGSPGDEKEGLGPGELAKARDEFLREHPEKEVPAVLPDRHFRIARSRPLLILRFVTPTTSGAHEGRLPARNVLAWSISFPLSQIDGGTVEYVVNTIRLREMFGDEELDEEAIGDPA
jgi:hypothetical protein